jgi:hypothetical protein
MFGVEHQGGIDGRQRLGRPAERAQRKGAPQMLVGA